MIPFISIPKASLAEELTPSLMKFHTLALALAFVSYTGAHCASVSAPSTEWTALQGDYDYLSDQQTGLPDSDIVGQGEDYGLFVTHNDFGSESDTDGTFGFRIRLDAPGGNKNEAKFTKAAWLGIDADFNDTIDVFIGVNLSGAKTDLGIFVPGAGNNDTPTSTSVSTTAYKTYEIGPSNYNYRPVDYKTDGGTTNDLNPGTKGEPDYYLSVLVDFSDIVAYLSAMEIEVTDQSAMRFVSATSRQGNKLNQDIGGIRGDENAGVSWSASGALTETVTANGIAVVPEPGAGTILMLGSVILMLRRRRQGT